MEARAWLAGGRCGVGAVARKVSIEAAPKAQSRVVVQTRFLSRRCILVAGTIAALTFRWTRHCLSGVHYGRRGLDSAGRYEGEALIVERRDVMLVTARHDAALLDVVFHGCVASVCLYKSRDNAVVGGNGSTALFAMIFGYEFLVGGCCDVPIGFCDVMLAVCAQTFGNDRPVGTENEGFVVAGPK